MALTDTNKNRIGKRRPSGPWKVPQSDPQPSGPKLPKIISGGPAFQPTKADDRGYAGGGTLDSMRKKIIGIKKDRGLTAKSGPRKGMTKKKATGRGGR